MRTVKPEEYNSIKDEIAELLDIRRENDYESSDETLPGAKWKDLAKMDEWISNVPKDGEVIIYCVRGGGVSNSVLDQLLENGVNARYIEGGIEGLKDAGGIVQKK